MSSRPEVVVYLATSVDGFVAREDGGLDWLEHDAGGEDYGYAALVGGVDAIVMGRGTFETVLGFDGPWPYAKPVIVMSRTLEAVPARLAEVDVRLSREAPAALLASLAADGIGRVYLDGGRLVAACLAEGLVDRLILTRIPVLLGGGRSCFGPLAGDRVLTLESAEAYPSGLVQERYRLRMDDQPAPPLSSPSGGADADGL